MCSQELNTVDARATALLGAVHLSRGQLEDFLHGRLHAESQMMVDYNQVLDFCTRKMAHHCINVLIFIRT